MPMSITNIPTVMSRRSYKNIHAHKYIYKVDFIGIFLPN